VRYRILPAPLRPRRRPDFRIDKDLACVGCQYNLRGLESGGRCPECGVPIANTIYADEWAPATTLVEPESGDLAGCATVLLVVSLMGGALFFAMPLLFAAGLLVIVVYLGLAIFARMRGGEGEMKHAEAKGTEPADAPAPPSNDQPPH
jgi:hypothetical protein